jgi:hypothetical protein
LHVFFSRGIYTYPEFDDSNNGTLVQKEDYLGDLSEKADMGERIGRLHIHVKIA